MVKREPDNDSEPDNELPELPPLPSPSAFPIQNAVSPGTPFALASPHQRTLSDSQIDKFRTYVEDQQLSLTRKFVRRINDTGYTTLDALLADFDKLVDVIWYSVLTTVNRAGHSLYGQEEYLITLADSLVDFMRGYDALESPRQLFKVLNRLDALFDLLLKADTPSHDGLRGTERVRLESIAERTRLAVVELPISEGYEEAISKVYEQVLDSVD